MSENSSMLNVRVDERTMLAITDRANEMDITVSDVVRASIDSSLGIHRGTDGAPFTTHQRPIIPIVRRELYRFYEYFSTNDPELSQAVEFVCDMATKFRLETEEADRKNYAIVRDVMSLDDKARDVMRELAVKGEVFIHISPEIETKTVEISILNPENVDVDDDTRIVILRPSVELRMALEVGEPAGVLERIPVAAREAIDNNTPICLNPHSTIHMKLGPPYETYGTSIIKPFLSELMNKHQSPASRPSDRLGFMAIFEARLDHLRLHIGGFINAILPMIAQLNDIESPADIRWYTPQHQKDRWAVSQGWKNGLISDAAYADMMDMTIDE
jgi:hypothetical protein